MLVFHVGLPSNITARYVISYTVTDCTSPFSYTRTMKLDCGITSTILWSPLIFWWITNRYVWIVQPAYSQLWSNRTTISSQPPSSSTPSVPFRGTHLVDSGEIYYLYLRSSKLKELRWEGYFKIWCCLHVLAACIFLGDVLLADEQIIWKYEPHMIFANRSTTLNLCYVNSMATTYSDGQMNQINLSVGQW